MRDAAGIVPRVRCYDVAKARRQGKAMGEQIRISATNLGSVASHDFCPRCFWVRLRMEHKLPFDSFPGIFSSIDVYTKRIVQGWFDERGGSPPWLAGLGELAGYVEPPHWSKFSAVDSATDILFRGTADGILRRSDGSHVIVDYKTARHSGSQDQRYPIYKAQLNAYARIGEERGFAPVSDLALIYMEPVTDDAAARAEESRRDDGFAMGFAADVVSVPLDPAALTPLLATTREVFELANAPSGRQGCKDCDRTARMIELF